MDSMPRPNRPHPHDDYLCPAVATPSSRCLRSTPRFRPNWSWAGLQKVAPNRLREDASSHQDPDAPGTASACFEIAGFWVIVVWGGGGGFFSLVTMTGATRKELAIFSRTTVMIATIRLFLLFANSGAVDAVVVALVDCLAGVRPNSRGRPSFLFCSIDAMRKVSEKKNESFEPQAVKTTTTTKRAYQPFPELVVFYESEI
mmetsp:Transcript_1859/g.4121  ORF Transcript_1859/g.4121 Transcript_1859/m.4121 type:complete len:201 (+) Transcript_1859:827-1429(+)